MIKKAKHYLNHGNDMEYYVDSEIEKIALSFVVLLYVICWMVSKVFLFATCPIWIIPYCIYKSRKEGANNG